MNSLIDRIDDIIQKRSLLKHPFYQMWTDGKLSFDSLTSYSKEYFQLVKAVPSFMTPIIDKAPNSMVGELCANQQEEKDHIKSWLRFAGALGVTKGMLEDYDGLAKTKLAVSELSSLMGSYDGGSCAMYAFEKEIPKISQVKLDGLAQFYGISSEEATEYFKLHTEADIRHAAVWRQILKKSSASDERLIRIADKSMMAQNLLLDGCHEAYC